jgi:S-adenosylmethionine:tRNA ribosyltransferase-isomerase
MGWQGVVASVDKYPELVREYDFALPEELIAQEPPEERAGARMLGVDRASGALRDEVFTSFPQMLRAGDLLVLNNSRVLPARLFARRAGAKAQQGQAAARIEVLLTEEEAPGEWVALVRPGRKVLAGERLEFPHEGAAVLEAEVLEHREFGERLLRFAPVGDFYGALDALGQMPLPPYIRRAQSMSTAADRERYQTVYAEERGSVAAPTAGLHFTEAVLEAVRARGVEIAYVTLHVGLGTFQPVRVERVGEIELHRERYTLPQATAEAVNRAVAAGRRVVAAGTTTVRTLEHCAASGGGVVPGHGMLAGHSGSTRIFISPGFRFRVVGGLLTNFHLPQSTLLMLVCAFAGVEPVLAAYRHAVAERYRFFSYGDCMFLG